MGKVRITRENLEPDVRVVAGDALTHGEQLRCAALSLACRYYVETIVKDGDLYREMVRDNRVLKPATYMGVLEVGFAFYQFVAGELTEDADAVSEAKSPRTKASRKKQKEQIEADLQTITNEPNPAATPKP
jgi:hypothetical protein